MWLVPALPCQDLPFHAAALRVIHDYRDPRYGFEPEFVLTLGRTQYFGFYLLGSLLAGWVGVPKALLLLVSAYLGGSILALRTLLVDLGREHGVVEIDRSDRLAALVFDFDLHGNGSRFRS